MHTSRELLRAADLALYRSKARGGGVATLYRPGTDTWEDLARQECREP
jgi:GGDEF domain-containing protein